MNCSDFYLIRLKLITLNANRGFNKKSNQITRLNSFSVNKFSKRDTTWVSDINNAVTSDLRPTKHRFSPIGTKYTVLNQFHCTEHWSYINLSYLVFICADSGHKVSINQSVSKCRPPNYHQQWLHNFRED